MEPDLSKVIVITGAGQGLGRALARRFASEGDSVVLIGRTAAKVEAAAKEIGAKAMAVTCDVTSADSVRKAFAMIAERNPKIDVLINNAAVYHPFQVKEATDKDIDEIIAANLNGPIYCTRTALSMMGRGGHIINVSSESVGMLFPHMSLYQASKAGLERFSQALYHELHPEGIRVTLVRAGMMMEEGKTFDINPERGMRFAQAAHAVGIKLGESPISHVNSITGIFRTLIDLPADMTVETVSLHGWRAN
jgi:meso-butanediol dehydrogenase / (S,S)-butanediol dehydrogenase / diacetyl reductase